ncbi:MAG: universal stress protein [Bacteroidota bacterium]
MITVKKILVTTDTSVESYSAMEYAAWLAEKEKASVTLLYSVDNLPSVAYHTVDLTFDKFRDEVLQVEKKRLEEFAERFQKNFTVKLNVVLTEGHAAQVIVQYAKDHNSDIIVMSTHGRTGIQHVVLGSVAERVVRTAHCPVLTVKSIVPKTSSAKKKNSKK